MLAWRALDSAAFESGCKHWFSSLTCVLVISKSSINQAQPGNVISLASEAGMASAGQKAGLRRECVNVCSSWWQWIFYADGWMGSIKTFRDGHISVRIQESPKHMFTSHWFQWMGWAEVEKYFALSLPLPAKPSRQPVRIAVIFQLCTCSKRLHKGNGNRKPSSWVWESDVLHSYQLKFSESTAVTSLICRRFLNHCEHPALRHFCPIEFSVPAYTSAEVCHGWGNKKSRCGEGCIHRDLLSSCIAYPSPPSLPTEVIQH